MDLPKHWPLRIGILLSFAGCVHPIAPSNQQIINPVTAGCVCKSVSAQDLAAMILVGDLQFQTLMDCRQKEIEALTIEAGPTK